MTAAIRTSKNSAGGHPDKGDGAAATIGYARTAPGEGTLAQQRRELERAGCSRIHEDQANSLGDPAQPALEQALASLEEGDTLVVWRLDRLGPSLAQLLATMKDLADRGVKFRSLREDIDTGAPGGGFVHQVMVALFECERALISERTRAGMQAAQEKGRTLGRPPALTEDQRREVREAVLGRGESIEEVARRHNVHTRTIRRVLGPLRKAKDDNPHNRAARSQEG